MVGQFKVGVLLTAITLAAVVLPWSPPDRTILAAAAGSSAAGHGSSAASSGSSHEANHEHKHEESHEHVDELAVAHATMALAVLIVVVSVGFEVLREVVKDKVPKIYQPVVSVVYGELTNMGFVGVIIFLLSHRSSEKDHSVFGVWSLRYFGERDLIKEQAELVHMLIFLLMILMVLFVTGALIYVYLRSRSWKQYEKMAVKNQTDDENLDMLQYIRQRRRFIDTCAGAPADFNFFEYRKIVISEEFAQMVELRGVDWILSGVFFTCLWFTMELCDPYEVYVLLVFLAALAYYSYVRRRHHQELRIMLLPPAPQAQGPSSSYGTFADTDTDDAEHEPPYTKLPLPKPRHWFPALVLGPSGDRHRSLFWPGVKGPDLHRAFLRVEFLVVSVIVACNVAWFAESLWAKHPFLLPLEIALLAVSVIALPGSIVDLADVTSVEEMKRERVVAEVNRRQRATKSVVILKSLASLDTFARRSHGSSIRPTSTEVRHSFGSKGQIKPANKKEEQFLVSLNEMFQSFDADQSGTIDLEEFRSLLSYVSPDLSVEEVNRLFSEMDDDDSGDVTFDEFALVMMSHHMSTTGMRKEDAKEMGERLWNLIDSEKDGMIDYNNLASALGKTGVKWNVSNIMVLFHEIDKDGNGHIDKQEFMEFLEEHVQEM